MKKILFTLLAIFSLIGTSRAQTEKAPAALPVLDSALIKEYSGKYDAGNLGIINISWEQDKLISSLEGKASAELKPTAIPDVLTIVGYGTLTFVRDDKKKVIKAVLDVQGQEFEGIKY